MEAPRISICTAYTDDYTIGRLCEEVNRIYASRFGYNFDCHILSCEDMMAVIQPKKHFTWYKVDMLIKSIQQRLKEVDETKSDSLHYVMWIDADAMVTNLQTPLVDIVEQAHRKDLIIAEDLHTCCPINAGVFMLKVCDWSLQLLLDMWSTSNYDDVFFYEQSALVRQLRKRREGLQFVNPFHSFTKNGPQGIKFFPHVAVYPHFIFSSNKGISYAEAEQLMSSANAAESLPTFATQLEPSPSSSSFSFIFHAAGMRSKLNVIKAVILKYHLPTNFSTWQEIEFRPLRNQKGHLETRKPPISVESSSAVVNNVEVEDESKQETT